MALLQTLQDSFSQSAVDANKWTTFTSNGGTVTESGGKLVLTNAVSTTDCDAEVDSATTNYDLTGSFALVQVLQVAPGTTSETDIFLKKDGSNYLLMQKSPDGSLYAVVVTAGSQSFNTSIAYNSATMKWWRIKEQSGTVYWDYSADGQGWTNLASTATPSFGVTALKVVLSSYEQTTDASAGAAWFANFNLAPVQPSPLARIPNRFVGPMAMRHNFRQPYVPSMTANIPAISAWAEPISQPTNHFRPKIEDV